MRNLILTLMVVLLGAGPLFAQLPVWAGRQDLTMLYTRKYPCYQYDIYRTDTTRSITGEVQYMDCYGSLKILPLPIPETFGDTVFVSVCTYYYPEVNQFPIPDVGIPNVYTVEYIDGCYESYKRPAGGGSEPMPGWSPVQQWPTWYPDPTKPSPPPPPSQNNPPPPTSPLTPPPNPNPPDPNVPLPTPGPNNEPQKQPIPTIPCGGTRHAGGGQGTTTLRVPVMPGQNVTVRYNTYQIPDNITIFAYRSDGTDYPLASVGWRGSDTYLNELNRYMTEEQNAPEVDQLGDPSGAAQFTIPSNVTEIFIKIDGPLRDTHWSVSVNCNN